MLPEDVANQLLVAFETHQLKTPIFPSLYPKIQLCIENDTAISEIARVIGLEPSVTSKIMLISNSVALRGSRQLKTLPEAITRLGTRSISSIILMVCLRDQFNSKDPWARATLTEIWLHSIEVALTSYFISKQLKLLSPEEVLVCGILHDIGLLPIVDFFSKNPEYIEHFDGCKHLSGVVGQKLTETWGQGGDISNIVGIHYTLDTNIVPDPGHTPTYYDFLVLIHTYCLIKEGILQEPPAYIPLFETKCTIGIAMITELAKEFDAELQNIKQLLLH